ncbi:tetratricopeptide repeat protein [Botrimarina hoheduenensis]|uniref:Tetratricopeptide repeat-like domain-containing protein n=1 Tax=Botrimarina hoheduenensis TaxID=2528000 RepID=A0A5C5WEZ5_9BACT|nr:tetratricopeptide repeat protein [Botrimarina hoheduenensis]TWT48625.1 hypothetical protein Pla111_04000 [Botrimarina hoheduenensis]
MDSEHRHELEENVLASWLERKIEAIKPQLPLIATVLIAGAAALLGWSAYKASNQDARGARWRSFTVAMEGPSPSLEGLKQAALDHPGTGVEEWAEVTWADGRLWFAANMYLRQRTQAVEALAEAKTAFEKLQSAKEPEVADRATYGLARVLEMEGNLDAAREQYGRVSGPFAPLAEQRAKELRSDRVVADYRWIAAAGEDTEQLATDEVRPDAEPDDIAMPSEKPAEEAAEADLDTLLEQFAAPDAEQDASEEAAPDETDQEAAQDAAADLSTK